MNTFPPPPPLNLALSEMPRAAYEGLRAFVSMRSLLREYRTCGEGDPVLVLPGYGASDSSTAFIRYFLKQIGFASHALALGRNLENAEDRIRSVDDATRFREKMGSLVVSRVRELAEQAGTSISLVGWSMGGLYAVDAAREVPELLRQVITLGSPFGDPRGTSLFTLMRRLSGSTVPLETQDFGSWLAKASVSEVPTKVIYSVRDGIVGTGIARLPESPTTEHCQINSSHIGFAHNPDALSEVASTLLNARPLLRP
ncbi:alpha/beta hydrolase [Parahaliea sp. F7430]|uniref:Alpha/beta hydrolase n=1 Tax=Sediminihaliea albiluteola TaxID=2758564 RepID=A0A7W2TXY9_9GAMM|nr:alpha/beta hydrolase [Sediminihaliea albiluteola]MBA6414012.1 alpha/beta hydrolase [Sediminihaliea albiluteola]